MCWLLLKFLPRFSNPSSSWILKFKRKSSRYSFGKLLHGLFLRNLQELSSEMLPGAIRKIAKKSFRNCTRNSIRNVYRDFFIKPTHKAWMHEILSKIFRRLFRITFEKSFFRSFYFILISLRIPPEIFPGIPSRMVSKTATIFSRDWFGILGNSNRNSTGDRSKYFRKKSSEHLAIIASEVLTRFFLFFFYRN